MFFRAFIPTTTALLLVTAAAFAAERQGDMSLVPPPPPSPALEIPPAPIELPYSYALNSNSTVPPELLQLAKPKPQAQRQPEPPFQAPAPMAARPANAPNLNPAYAMFRGFGAPRFGFGTPGQPQADSSNTWFNASLQWYQQRQNSQQFFQNLQNKPAVNESTAQTPPSSTLAYESPAPHAVSHPTHHRAHKSARRFRKVVIVSR